MKKKLTVTLIQTELYWHDRQRNLAKLEATLSTEQTGDLVVLPEMFTTGFTLEPHKVFDTPGGETFNKLRMLSQKYQVALSGSVVIKENQSFFNRYFFFSPGGKEVFYDKRHLFTMANEHKHYTRGNNQVVFEYMGWRIKPLICYDLRFPVWARNKEGYHLLTYVANWPSSRIAQWHSLVVARAIENQAYVVAVNRTGTDGNGFEYSGHSMVVSPKGEILYQAPENKEDIAKVELDFDKLIKGREKFPVLNDSDDFCINNSVTTEL